MGIYQKFRNRKSLILLNFLLIIGVFFSYGCLKFWPVIADFETEQIEYVAGETVKTINNSLNAKSYKWTLPNGETRTSRDIEYTLPENLDDGTITFKLEAFGKLGKHPHQKSNNVYVKAAWGKVVFWKTSTCGCSYIDVTIDGTTISSFTDFLYTPECGDPQASAFDLKVGTYNYNATDGTKAWSGTINITKNCCLKIHLN